MSFANSSIMGMTISGFSQFSMPTPMLWNPLSVKSPQQRPRATGPAPQTLLRPRRPSNVLQRQTRGTARPTRPAVREPSPSDFMSSGAARTYRAEELERATERSSGPRRDPPTNFRRRASSNLLRRGEGGGAGGTSSIGTTRRDGCAAASTIVSRERRVASCPRRGKI